MNILRHLLITIFIKKKRKHNIGSSQITGIVEKV